MAIGGWKSPGTLSLRPRKKFSEGCEMGQAVFGFLRWGAVARTSVFSVSSAANPNALDEAAVGSGIPSSARLAQSSNPPFCTATVPSDTTET